MTPRAWIVHHTTQISITFQGMWWEIVCQTWKWVRDAIFYGRITKDFLPESVKRKTDWRLSLSEPSLPTGKARVGQRRIWKRNWFNINQQGWLIGREDLKCLRIHIWEAPGILGGHGRHCKLILGKGVGQRTLPLSGLSPSWVTTLSRRVGTAQLMPGCPQIKKKATFSFSDDEIAMLVHLRPRFCLPQTVGVLNWQC